MATKLKNQPPGVQFAVFFAMALGMFFVSMLITGAFFGDLGILKDDKQVSPALLNKFKLAQFASAILSFVIPAIAFGYWASYKPFRFIGLK
ncbi:MAG TPA: hypothetical protein VD996_18275, partial [Chitinophagaceae bacterium]|nr:hypothetical protein [Chitinophagaceae bacterium]